MGVEAARLALRSAPGGTAPDALWFSTASPAYLDKNNASTLHAALRLDTDVAAFDFGGALRSSIGALRTALDRWRHRVARHLRPARRTPHEWRRVGHRRRRGRAAHRRRFERPRHRRIPRRREHDRGVPRALAHSGLDAVAGLGRALRRDQVRPAGRAGLERGTEVDGSLRRPDPTRHRHRHARPGGSRHQRPARYGQGSPGRRSRHDGRQHRYARTRRCSSQTRSRAPNPVR